MAPSWPTGLRRPVARSLGVDYDTAWARRYEVRLARALFLDHVARPALRVVADPRIAGLDRLEGLEEPVVFAANHTSHLDAPLILSALPARLRHRTVVSAAADYFFDRPWKAALSAGLVGAIPTERQRINRRSMDVAAELLDDGWNLVFFPEGGRSPDGWAREFSASAAYLASRAGVPVVPVHVQGTGTILGKRRPGLRRGETTVTFGRPLWATEGVSARRLGEQVEASIGVLADEAATDWWSARLRAGASSGAGQGTGARASGGVAQGAGEGSGAGAGEGSGAGAGGGSGAGAGGVSGAGAGGGAAEGAGDARGVTPALAGPQAAPWRRAWALGPDPTPRGRRSGRWPLR